MKIALTIKFINVYEKLLKLILFSFFIICVLDPASKLTNMKIPLFGIVLIFGVIYMLWIEGKILTNKNVLIYFVLFSIVIPGLALINVLVFNSDNLQNFNIIGSLKNYSFLVLIFLLLNLKFNSLKLLVIALTIMSLIIIGFYLVFKFQLIPGIGSRLNEFGIKYTIFKLAPGNFFGYSHTRIYFWTSPLLVLSIGYYANRYSKYKKAIQLLLLSINIFGMLISGSRINVFFSIFVAFIIIYFQHFNLKRFLFLIMLFTALLVGIIYKYEDIEFSKSASDSTKIEMINQYFDIYTSSIKNLIIGEGLGAGFYIESRGIYLTFTELTYFEIIRKYGFVLGGFLIYLMILPLMFYKKIDNNDRWIIFVYACYLVMAFFNPFYFSSSGFLLLMFTLITAFKVQSEAYVN